MSETLPDLAEQCWPVDWSCAQAWADDSDNDTIRLRAEALATSTLRALTGYQVGGCPVQVRPCAKSCLDASAYRIYPVDGQPGSGPSINSSGQWINACGCQNDCACAALSEVILPAPVGQIVSVLLDGQPLDVRDYRVDNGNRLVRTDGEVWPACQDMEALPDADGAFTVTYLQGAAVDGTAAFVAGLLAWEFSKACGGANCALPRGATSIARAGLTIEMTPGSFPDGLTGVLAVDAWLRQVNPYAVKVAAAVFSPDRRRTRQTTLGGLA